MSSSEDKDKQRALDLIANNFNGKKGLLVTAPPGTGKTYLSILAIMQLAECNLLKENQSVLALTFSKNARAQLESKADELIKKQHRYKLLCKDKYEISNFHAFFQGYIWANRRYLGLPLNLVVSSPSERKKQIQGICNALDLPIGEWELISSALEDKELGKFCTDKGTCDLDVKISAIADEIIKINKSGHIYFGDFAYYFNVLLDNEHLLGMIRRRYPYLILDEYQDSSYLQNKIIEKLLDGPDNKAIFLADERQLIHEWRGADLNRIDSLRKKYDLEEITLESYFRFRNSKNHQKFAAEIRASLSGDTIKRVSSPVIGFYGKDYVRDGVSKVQGANDAELRIKKEAKFNSLVPSLLRGPKEKAGAYGLLKEIRKAENGNPHSIAIMPYTNDSVQSLRRNIRFTKTLSNGEKEHDFIRDLLTISTFDKYEITALILKYLFPEKCKTISKSKISKELKEPLKYNLLKDNIGANFKKDLVKTLESCESIKTVVLSVKGVIERHFSKKYVTDNLDIDIWGLVKKISSFPDRINDDDSYKTLINGMLVQNNHVTSHKQAVGVFVLNMHQSKGREFDYVILTDVSHWALPNNDKARRLLYVALTRAKKKIYILKDHPDVSSLIKDLFGI